MKGDIRMSKNKVEAWVEACKLDRKIVELENVWTVRYNELHSRAPLVKPHHVTDIERKLTAARVKLGIIMTNKDYDFDYRLLPTYRATVM
jgi:hypothetical protein